MTEHFGIEPFYLIGSFDITLHEFELIFNEQDAEFPLVISREIYSFLEQPKKEEIQQIRHMVFIELETMQQSVKQSIKQSVQNRPLLSEFFDWIQYDRILKTTEERVKIGEIILRYIPKWYAYTSTKEHNVALMYNRQAESDAYQKQVAEFQTTIDEHDSSISVYWAPWRVPTPPPSKQSPPRKKRKIMDCKSETETDIFKNSFRSDTNCWTELHPDTQYMQWCETINDIDKEYVE